MYRLWKYSVAIVSPLEAVCARVILAGRELILCSCYRSPSASISFCEDLHDLLNRLILRFPNSLLLLFGDFNFPNIEWHKDSITVRQNTSESTDFLNVCHDFNLVQFVHRSTRTTATCANTLNIVLTNVPDLISPITYLTGISDHWILHFTLKGQIPSKKHTKIIQDLGRADIASITNELEAFTDDYVPKFWERSLEENC